MPVCKRTSSPCWPSESYWAESVGWEKAEIAIRGKPGTGEVWGRWMGPSLGWFSRSDRVQTQPLHFYEVTENSIGIQANFVKMIRFLTIFHRNQLTGRGERAGFPRVLPKLPHIKMLTAQPLGRQGGAWASPHAAGTCGFQQPSLPSRHCACAVTGNVRGRGVLSFCEQSRTVGDQKICFG